MEEVWKDVVGFDGRYAVSNMGRVKSFFRGERILTPVAYGRKRNYRAILLGRGNRFAIHRLVAITFLGMREGLQVCHNNHDASDNRLENLRWDDQFGNMQDNVMAGKSTRGERDAMHKLKDKEVHFVRYLRDCGLSYPRIAKIVKMSRQEIARICRYERWTWLETDVENYRKAA